MKLRGGETEGEGGECAAGKEADFSSRGLVGYDGAVAGRSTSKEENRLIGGMCVDRILLLASVELDSGSKAAPRLRAEDMLFSEVGVFGSMGSNPVSCLIFGG